MLKKTNTHNFEHTHIKRKEDQVTVISSGPRDLRPAFCNVNTPGPQDFDNFGRDGRGQWDPNED